MIFIFFYQTFYSHKTKTFSPAILRAKESVLTNFLQKIKIWFFWNKLHSLYIRYRFFFQLWDPRYLKVRKSLETHRDDLLENHKNARVLILGNSEFPWKSDDLHLFFQGKYICITCCFFLNRNLLFFEFWNKSYRIPPPPRTCIFLLTTTYFPINPGTRDFVKKKIPTGGGPRRIVSCCRIFQKVDF